MTFGWQGFQFDHPDDWAPIAVSGSIKEGYARIASPSRQAVQIRWKRSVGDLDTALANYFGRLEGDSKRRRQPFKSESRKEDGKVLYRWVGDGQGRGCIFAADGATYFLELTGGRGDSLLPRLRALMDSFQSSPPESHLWSVLGLRVALPPRFRLEKHVFQAGRTQLQFVDRSCRIECTRWGFAEQLLEKYSLGEWAKASLGMAKAASVQEADGVRLSASVFMAKKEAIVQLQAEQNQIITVKATYMKEKGRPSWDWLT